jgi:hypothetical protein
MPGNGPYRWYFVGKTPWIAWVLCVLLFGNTLAGMVCFPLYERFVHHPVRSPMAAWFQTHFVGIQFVLLALVVLVFVTYRKDVRYEYRGAKRR